MFVPFFFCFGFMMIMDSNTKHYLLSMFFFWISKLIIGEKIVDISSEDINDLEKTHGDVIISWWWWWVTKWCFFNEKTISQSMTMTIEHIKMGNKKWKKMWMVFFIIRLQSHIVVWWTTTTVCVFACIFFWLEQKKKKFGNWSQSKRTERGLRK